jgi:hypothetical protein
MSKFKAIFGGGGRSSPVIDYAAIQRQQDAERKRLQDIRDEEYRVSGISDYIDYMYDNPENVSRRSATGSFYTAISEGKVPNEALSGYRTDKSIGVKDVKENTAKYFTNRAAVPSIKKGRIKLGKKAITRPEGVLGGGDDAEKKNLLGA